jgi:uncharacterized protein (TIGR00369 family)
MLRKFSEASRAVGNQDTIAPLRELNRIIRENRTGEYRSPAMELGFAPLEFAPGASRWRWEQQPPTVLNPFGTIHGGFLGVFVDELFATAIASVLEDGEWAMTAETKISHLRALYPGPLSGHGRVVRRGRTLAFLEAEVCDADGRSAVRASSTWSISR